MLDRLDLELNDTKTRIVDAKQESFNFLGFFNQGEQGIEVGQKLSAYLPGTEIACENQGPYNAIDRTGAYADTVGR